MTATQIILLTLQGLLFALWSFAMFRALLRLTRTAPVPPLDSTGGLPAMIARNSRSMARLVTDPAFAPDRRLLLLTPALIAATGASVVLIKP